jgi:hypothetical protein
MIDKVADAGLMLWQALDTRERVALAWVGFVAFALVLDRAGRKAQARSDERVATRAAQLVREGR